MLDMKKLTILIVAFMLVIPALVLAKPNVENISIEVKGLSCPFCVAGLEKKLKEIDSVDTVKVSLKKSLVRLQTKSGQSVSDAKLQSAIKDAGFTPGKIVRNANTDT